MARVTGPDAAERLCYVLRADNAIGTAAGLPAIVYADAGGTQLADILTTGGAAITGSRLTVDATSLLPLFQYPDGVTTVYVSVNGGPISAVRATLGGGTGGAVASVNGQTGAVTITAASISAAPLASPTFTGTVAGITKAMVGLGNVDNTADASKVFTESQVTNLTTDLAAKAALASPTFTGVPAAPTAAASTSTTQLATTAFVTTADNLKANIASPTFTGTPAAPTATPGDSSTTLATTAFVTTADNLKANLASPTFTGTPTLPTGTIATTQTAGNNTTALATTAFVTTAAAAKTDGAASSTDGQLALFSGTTGKALKTSAVALDANADMTGLRRLTRTLAADPAVAGYERFDINYAVTTSSSDLHRVYVSSVLTSWRNEVGFLRGMPHSGYKDDAVVRGVQRSDLTTETGGWLELQNNARTQVLYKRDWFGKLYRSDGSAAAIAMADVLVLVGAASIPSGTPAGTVIVRI